MKIVRERQAMEGDFNQEKQTAEWQSTEDARVSYFKALDER